MKKRIEIRLPASLPLVPAVAARDELVLAVNHYANELKRSLVLLETLKVASDTLANLQNRLVSVGLLLEAVNAPLGAMRAPVVFDDKVVMGKKDFTHALIALTQE